MKFKMPLLTAALLVGGMACGGSSSSAPKPDVTTLTVGHQLENSPGWYRDAVVYQVWVRAFADGINADGIGDIPGVDSKLDYLQSLGINTIWLSPIFECAYKGANMHGYDTTDYYAINSSFGQKADLQKLIDDVHARGMRILFDFVPNHTSTGNAWFTDAATRGSWYIWQPTLPAGWSAPWGGGDSNSVWAYDTGKYYYTAFGSGMADLNYYNPDVRNGMKNVVRYWLDRGFDGMRVDAVRYLCESGPGVQADTPDTHARLQDFRAVLDEYNSGNAHPHPGNDPAKFSAKVMIAEAWTSGVSTVAPYYGNGANEFHMCLDFSAPWAFANAITGSDASQVTSLWEYEQKNYPAGYRTASFDSNHDNVISRPGTLYGGQKNQIILHEALNLLAPGTPIIYYGNEIGMTGKAGTDLNLRSNMDWATATAQAAQPDSILSWCKYLIKARGSYKALRGTYATLKTSPGTGDVLAYLMTAGSENIVVVANLTGKAQTLAITDLTSHGVAADAPVKAILGDLKGADALSGTSYPVNNIPPYGVRVIYASGGAFQTTLHGDLP
jgi:alpha-glucosidase